MVQEVGGLRDQPLAILADGGKRGLDRLLAELLGTMRHALVDELACVGRGRAGLRALVHAGRQIVQGELVHARLNSTSGRRRGGRRHGSSRVGNPARAMCSLAWRTLYSPK